MLSREERLSSRMHSSMTPCMDHAWSIWAGAESFRGLWWQHAGCQEKATKKLFPSLGKKSVHFMGTPLENVGENPANAAWLPVPRSATLLHPALK